MRFVEVRDEAKVSAEGESQVSGHLEEFFSFFSD